jgi:hypothetical protein
MSDTTNGDDNQTAGSGDQAPKTPRDLVEALRELALRIIQAGNFHYGPGSRPFGPAQLLPGALPPDAPIALPVPEGSRIIGTVVHSGSPTTVLAVSLPPDAILTFYRERMTALGWTEQERPEYHQQCGGFTQSAPRPPIENMLFFVGTRGPSLDVMITSEPETGAPTEVRLILHTDAPEPARGPHRRWDAFEKLIPPLEPPAGAEQRFGGGGGGGWRSSATPRTDLDLPAIPLTMTHSSPRPAGSAAAPA